jgi:hypothetical protein
MKGKVLSILTAILFGASMLIAPVGAVAAEKAKAATEDTAKPAKKKATTKKKATKKKPTKKKATKAKKKNGTKKTKTDATKA